MRTKITRAARSWFKGSGDFAIGWLANRAIGQPGKLSSARESSRTSASEDVVFFVWADCLQAIRACRQERKGHRHRKQLCSEEPDSPVHRGAHKDDARYGAPRRYDQNQASGWHGPPFRGYPTTATQATAARAQASIRRLHLTVGGLRGEGSLLPDWRVRETSGESRGA